MFTDPEFKSPSSSSSCAFSTVTALDNYANISNQRPCAGAVSTPSRSCAKDEQWAFVPHLDVTPSRDIRTETTPIAYSEQPKSTVPWKSPKERHRILRDVTGKELQARPSRHIRSPGVENMDPNSVTGLHKFSLVSCFRCAVLLEIDACAAPLITCYNCQASFCYVCRVLQRPVSYCCDHSETTLAVDAVRSSPFKKAASQPSAFPSSSSTKRLQARTPLGGSNICALSADERAVLERKKNRRHARRARALRDAKAKTSKEPFGNRSDLTRYTCGRDIRADVGSSLRKIR